MHAINRLENLYTPPTKREDNNLRYLPSKRSSKKLSIIYLISLFCIGAASQEFIDKQKPIYIVKNNEELEVKVLTEVLSALRDSLLARTEQKTDFIQVVTNKRAKLRNNPSTDANILGVVESGTVLLLLSEQEDGWAKVTSPMGEVSWVKKELVSLVNT